MHEVGSLRHGSLPPPTRRGLHRDEAAAYVGVGPSKFDAMVADGRMPKAKQIDGRRVFDRFAIDRAFDALPGGESTAQGDQDTADDDGGWNEVLK